MKAREVVIVIDKAVNVFFFNGYSDETISSRCYRLGELGGDAWWAWWQRRIDAVARWFGQDAHCKDAFEYERDHGHLPPELRPNRGNG